MEKESNYSNYYAIYGALFEVTIEEVAIENTR